MLGIWKPHINYQHYVKTELSKLASYDSNLLYEHKDLISKLFILDLDPLKSTIHHLYSLTGRPSNHQPEIFRAFVIMNALGITIEQWCSTACKNPVLSVIAGFEDGYTPKVASYYDFINRIYNIDDAPMDKSVKKKPKKKLKKGEKLPSKHPGIVDRLVEKILEGRRLDARPELTLQNIFANVSVYASTQIGLIDKNITISGDGTCIETGASPYGRKTCKCKEKGIYKCDCNRRFSDPLASWGWDSHNERYFYGYTGYFLSTYNKDLKLDLPLYLRLVDAKRHDSVSAVVSIAEYRDMYPDITMQTFLSDSASDNYSTYRLLDEWDISAIIALNQKKGNTLYKQDIRLNEHGVPICFAGYKMVHWGSNPNDRNRVKWRCPLKAGKKKSRPNPCSACNSCSESEYGRTIYTKTKDDIRLFPSIPRGSITWKNLMKQRTAAERINNRILNDYGIGSTKQRGKKRIFFMTTIAAMNIHLDAQLSKLVSDGLFDFQGTFGITDAA